MFTSIPPINAGINLVVSTVAFGASVAIWSVSQRSAHLMQQGHWLPGYAKRGPAAVAGLGIAFAAVAVLAGTLVGPRVPGADADPIYSFQEELDPTRKVPSPYVNLHQRLVDQTDQQLFTVTADAPSYWRIAGLDTYKDNIWQIAGGFSAESGRLSGNVTMATKRPKLSKTIRSLR